MSIDVLNELDQNQPGRIVGAALDSGAAREPVPDNASTVSTFHRAALAYARQGFRVFPLAPRRRHL